MIELKDITGKINSYNALADVSLVKVAHDFSAKKHEGQIRKSGQPYLTHPLEVADILAEMKLDVASIVAAILHDTIEDTQTTKKEIADIFGSEIAELVDGVTKLSKLEFNKKEDRDAENFRKMILAMSKDIRVVLIKLADRLHNLRTLQFMPEVKQVRIAQETLDIYAPLASRLGIEWIKIELEELGFRFSKPDVFRQIDKKMSRLRKNREKYIDRVEKEINRHFHGNIDHYEIQGRMKHSYGIYKKMERQSVAFEQVHDLLAFRILTNTVEECYEALGLIHSLWKPIPGRFKDYVAMPKSNNYQSLHTTVICLEGERVEFQIRTNEMHEVAEKGIASHWKYKEDGKLDMESESTFAWIRQLVEWQKELSDSIEFMDTVKLDLFPSDIYIFTPKGDVRPLPHGATPVDFAYSIHTDVGTHCSGARVNGRMVPISYTLESGDTVEIITNEHQLPSRDWLKFVMSSRAKASIRQHLKFDQRHKSISLGQKIFEEECLKYGVQTDEVIQHKEYKDYLRKKGVGNESGFYSDIAYGKISVPLMLGQLIPEKRQSLVPKSSLLSRIFKKVSERTKNLVLVHGLDDVLVSFAKCCSPIQGDQIVGFVTRSRGVTVHRVECSKVLTIDPNRRVSVDWNFQAELIRPAKLRILCENKTGMLAKITQVISEKKINITKAIVNTTRDEKAVIHLEVGVKNVKEMTAMMRAVDRISGVISSERKIAS